MFLPVFSFWKHPIGNSYFEVLLNTRERCERFSSLLSFGVCRGNFVSSKNIDASMSLEKLPKELLYKIFNLLSTVDLLHAFINLNSYFNNIVSYHVTRHKCIDLQTTSKYDLSLFWKQYLPELIDRVTSLHLSDDINTPDQIVFYVECRIYLI